MLSKSTFLTSSPANKGAFYSAGQSTGLSALPSSRSVTLNNALGEHSTHQRPESTVPNSASSGSSATSLYFGQPAWERVQRTGAMYPSSNWEPENAYAPSIGGDAMSGYLFGTTFPPSTMPNDSAAFSQPHTQMTRSQAPVDGTRRSSSAAQFPDAPAIRSSQPLPEPLCAHVG